MRRRWQRNGSVKFLRAFGFGRSLHLLLTSIDTEETLIEHQNAIPERQGVNIELLLWLDQFAMHAVYSFLDVVQKHFLESFVKQRLLLQD